MQVAPGLGKPHGYRCFIDKAYGYARSRLCVCVCVCVCVKDYSNFRAKRCCNPTIHTASTRNYAVERMCSQTANDKGRAVGKLFTQPRAARIWLLEQTSVQILPRAITVPTKTPFARISLPLHARSVNNRWEKNLKTRLFRNKLTPFSAAKYFSDVNPSASKHTDLCRFPAEPTAHLEHDRSCLRIGCVGDLQWSACSICTFCNAQCTSISEPAARGWHPAAKDGGQAIITNTDDEFLLRSIVRSLFGRSPCEDKPKGCCYILSLHTNTHTHAHKQLTLGGFGVAIRRLWWW